jgi:hypothetical protein
MVLEKNKQIKFMKFDFPKINREEKSVDRPAYNITMLISQHLSHTRHIVDFEKVWVSELKQITLLFLRVSHS